MIWEERLLVESLLWFSCCTAKSPLMRASFLKEPLAHRKNGNGHQLALLHPATSSQTPPGMPPCALTLRGPCWSERCEGRQDHWQLPHSTPNLKTVSSWPWWRAEPASAWGRMLQTQQRCCCFSILLSAAFLDIFPSAWVTSPVSCHWTQSYGSDYYEK